MQRGRDLEAHIDSWRDHLKQQVSFRVCQVEFCHTSILLISSHEFIETSKCPWSWEPVVVLARVFLTVVSPTSTINVFPVGETNKSSFAEDFCTCNLDDELEVTAVDLDKSTLQKRGVFHYGLGERNSLGCVLRKLNPPELNPDLKFFIQTCGYKAVFNKTCGSELQTSWDSQKAYLKTNYSQQTNFMVLVVPFLSAKHSSFQWMANCWLAEWNLNFAKETHHTKVVASYWEHRCCRKIMIPSTS